MRDYQQLNDSYKAVQAENYQLRDYIINLQSRLIESQGDFPPAPSNINLQQPVGGLPGQDGQDGTDANGETSVGGAPTAPMAGAALSMMQAGQKTEGVDPTLQRA